MNGAYLIGGENRTSSETFSGIEAATGQPLDIAFSITPLGDIAQACALAAAAFDAYRETTPAARACFSKPSPPRSKPVPRRSSRAPCWKPACRRAAWPANWAAPPASSACSPRSCAKAPGPAQ
jgi:hypothetical protein